MKDMPTTDITVFTETRTIYNHMVKITNHNEAFVNMAFLRMGVCRILSFNTGVNITGVRKTVSIFFLKSIL
jgi:hypothetical protein